MTHLQSHRSRPHLFPGSCSEYVTMSKLLGCMCDRWQAKQWSISPLHGSLSHPVFFFEMPRKVEQHATLKHWLLGKRLVEMIHETSGALLTYLLWLGFFVACVSNDQDGIGSNVPQCYFRQVPKKQDMMSPVNFCGWHEMDQKENRVQHTAMLLTPMTHGNGIRLMD